MLDMIITSQKQKIKTSLLLAFLVLSFFLPSQKTQAKVYPDWAAEKYSKINEITLKPCESQKIKIGFYNRGAYNWRNTGKNYVSVYTYKPKYRQSVFADKTWLSFSHPTKLKDSLAGPNSLGYFEFYLKAPKKEGVYKETFALAAENKTWIPGGQFELIVTVTSTPPIKEIANEETKNITAEEMDLKATRLNKINPLILDPNQEITFSILFLNQGKTAWQTRKILLDGNVVWQNETGEIKNGSTEIATLSLKAPSENGNYNWHFILIANDKPVEGGSVDLPLTVGDISVLTTSSTLPIAPALEPNIRIGLFTTEEPLEIKIFSDYELRDTAGQVFLKLNEKDKIILSFKEKNKNYHAIINEQNFDSQLPLQLVAKNPGGYYTLVNYTRNPRWTDHVNYNQFRGTLEMRHAKTGYTWVINELLLEDYLKGMAEANDTSPPEFLKALMTAARTYAYYNIQHPTKHVLGNFILDSDNDQVYRGLVREKASPNTTAAVLATTGTMVVYKGGVVVTPYFARSSGRTRSWKEVFGGDKPWLVSVTTKYDKGKTRWGHGVGMSANDAIQRAKKEKLSWQEILKYYYQGVELQQLY